jgi:hypothetical protein
MRFISAGRVVIAIGRAVTAYVEVKWRNNHSEYTPQNTEVCFSQILVAPTATPIAVMARYKKGLCHRHEDVAKAEQGPTPRYRLLEFAIGNMAARSPRVFLFSVWRSGDTNGLPVPSCRLCGRCGRLFMSVLNGA